MSPERKIRFNSERANKPARERSWEDLALEMYEIISFPDGQELLLEKERTSIGPQLARLFLENLANEHPTLLSEAEELYRRNGRSEIPDKLIRKRMTSAINTLSGVTKNKIGWMIVKTDGKIKAGLNDYAYWPVKINENAPKYTTELPNGHKYVSENFQLVNIVTKIRKGQIRDIKGLEDEIKLIRQDKKSANCLPTAIAKVLIAFLNHGIREEGCEINVSFTEIGNNHPLELIKISTVSQSSQSVL